MASLNMNAPVSTLFFFFFYTNTSGFLFNLSVSDRFSCFSSGARELNVWGWEYFSLQFKVKRKHQTCELVAWLLKIHVQTQSFIYILCAEENDSVVLGGGGHCVTYQPGKNEVKHLNSLTVPISFQQSSPMKALTVVFQLGGKVVRLWSSCHGWRHTGARELRGCVIKVVKLSPALRLKMWS